MRVVRRTLVGPDAVETPMRFLIVVLALLVAGVSNAATVRDITWKIDDTEFAGHLVFEESWVDVGSYSHAVTGNNYWLILSDIDGYLCW